MADTKGKFEGLRADLRAALDEHDFDELSLTFTASKKRIHGSLNFEKVLEGDRQEKLPMSTKEA
ncbi:MAG: hypothetical protein ACHQC8_02660 [Solirubrobacterales bacterium]